MEAEVVYDVRDLVKVYPGQARPANKGITLQVHRALRQGLLGPLTWQIVLDLAILAGFTIVVCWVVGQKMDWRRG